MARLTATAAVLLTKDLLAAAKYYEEKLGFETDLFGDPPNFAILRRDALSLMLALASPQAKLTPNWKIVDKTWNVYFWVDDADALYADFQRRGAIIDYTIYNTPWGTREFGVQDLDEHDIAFGQIL